MAKVIEEGWNKLWQMVGGKLPPEAERPMQNTFYAGATHMMISMAEMQENNEASPELLQRWLTGVADEIEEFHNQKQKESLK